MNLVAIIKLLLSFASTIANYIHDKQLLEAGEAKAILESINNANETIARANNARANANELPVSKDEFNRDNE